MVLKLNVNTNMFYMTNKTHRARPNKNTQKGQHYGVHRYTDRLKTNRYTDRQIGNAFTKTWPSAPPTWSLRPSSRCHPVAVAARSLRVLGALVWHHPCFAFLRNFASP